MLILEIAIILIASKIAGSLSVRLGQPSVLGKLLIGIVLGPSLLGLLNETESLAEFSQIGVIRICGGCCDNRCVYGWCSD